jgi:hypothetical protein
MKKVLLVIILPIAAISCTKSSGTGPKADLNTDSVKLVGKDWYWGGKSIPQLITIRFNANDSGSLTECVNLLPPYQYFTFKFPWKVLSKDSISVSGSKVKIYSITDSVLVTSNFIVGGPGGAPIGDTSKNTFKTY